MRVLFINAQDTNGGAALAAYRLAKGLETHFNTENYFIVAKKYSADSNVFCTRKNEIQAFIELMTDKILNKVGLQYQYFPFSTSYILKKTRELKPDIISLHNTHEGYFKTALLKKLSRIAPIAWTLHDMWSFTGNAAHTFGDESWKQMKNGPNDKKTYPHIGIDTGKWLLKQKKRIYRDSNIHVITPSQWMHDQVSQSPVFTGKPNTLIPHGLDLELFSPRNKSYCRNVLGIAPDAKTLIFTSAGDLDECPWKGGKLLLDILTALDKQTPRTIDVLVIGKGELKIMKQLKNLRVTKVGFVTSEMFMPILLSAADLFIYPTRADSFGLVLTESIACGTPAVSFDIGGCKDIIKNDISGAMIPPFDCETFAAKTIRILFDDSRLESLSRTSRQFATGHFSIQETASQHYKLFQAILNQNMEIRSQLGSQSK